MKNLYQILGLPDFSNIEEVKKQFRKLAVKYHPDKNPEGADSFRQIAEAYEILSDPELKNRYDYSLRTKTRFVSVRKKSHRSPYKEKNYADEKEQERRKYYNRHYKPHATHTRTKISKKNWDQAGREFRNILLAVPLTVFLLMLLLNFFEKHRMDEPEKEYEVSKNPVAEMKKNDEKWYGRKMYGSLFPLIKNLKPFARIILSNQSGKDMIVLLLKPHPPDTLIQSIFLPDHFMSDSLDVMAPTFILRVQTGKNYNPLKEYQECRDIMGGFETDEDFWESEKNLPAIEQKIILSNEEKGFKKINRCRFFGRYQ